MSHARRVRGDVASSVATPLPPSSKRVPVHRWLNSPQLQMYFTTRAPTGLYDRLPSKSAHLRTNTGAGGDHTATGFASTTRTSKRPAALYSGATLS
jgi:hypothetical protein